MPAPHQHTPLVRFDGDWSDADRSRIQQAIDQLDLAMVPDASASEDFSWLCVQQEQGTNRFFFAHWLYRPLVLTAPTVEQLVQKIAALSPSDLS